MFSKVRKHIETRPTVMVATVCARQLWPETATAIIGVLNNPQYRAFSLFHRGSMLHTARNTVAKVFLEHKNRPDYLLFVDDDMVFRHDALEQLLANHKDVVTGNAFTRQYPVKPVVGMFDTDPAKKGRVSVLIDYQKDALQPIDSCGMAFTLISRNALEKAGPKPFDPMFFPETDGELHEDSSFCWRVKEAGVQVWLNSSVQVGHIGDVIFDERDFEAGKEELRTLIK